MPPSPVTWIAHDWALMRAPRRNDAWGAPSEFLVYVHPTTGLLTCQCQCEADIGASPTACVHIRNVQRALMRPRQARDPRWPSSVTPYIERALCAGVEQRSTRGVTRLVAAATAARRAMGTRDLESAYHQDRTLVHAIIHHPWVTNAQVQKILAAYPAAWCIRALLALPPVQQDPKLVRRALGQFRRWQMTPSTWQAFFRLLPTTTARARWHISTRAGREEMILGLARLSEAEAARIVPEVVTARDLTPYLRRDDHACREATFRLLAHVLPRGLRRGTVRSV